MCNNRNRSANICNCNCGGNRERENVNTFTQWVPITVTYRVTTGNNGNFARSGFSRENNFFNGESFSNNCGCCF